MSEIKPISSAKNPAGCLTFLFAVMVIAGAAEFGFLFLPAAYRIARARSWVQVPCKIISSKLVVRSVSSQRSTSYAVVVKYSYEFNGIGYESDRYQFLSVQGFRDYRAKLAIVNRLRHGTWATCFVNPEQPEQAVIERGWTLDMWPVLGTSLAFMLGGVFFRVSVTRISGDRQRTVPFARGRVGGFVVSLAVAIFWNGAVTIGFYSVFQSAHRNLGSFIFLVPFVCIGLGLAVLVLIRFLAMFKPGPQLPPDNC